MIIDSKIGFLEIDLNLLRIHELANPKMTPMSSETRPNRMKSPKIMRPVEVSTLEVSFVYFITVLNRIIDTASLMMPSPNTMLKSFGSFS
jgi:hypothetical protein